jgi:hypothetical protein
MYHRELSNSHLYLPYLGCLISFISTSLDHIAISLWHYYIYYLIFKYIFEYVNLVLNYKKNGSSMEIQNSCYHKCWTIYTLKEYLVLIFFLNGWSMELQNSCCHKCWTIYTLKEYLVLNFFFKWFKNGITELMLS